MALYTPFLADATAKVSGAMMQKQAGQLAQRAYMGDEQALGELYRVDPNTANQIRNQKLQEEQNKLANRATEQGMQANQQQMNQSAQQFAQQNQQMLQGLMQNAVKLPSHQEAQQYLAGQINQLRQSGVQIPPEITAETFTPEMYDQVRQVYAAPEDEGFSLSQGQTRFDAKGNPIASVAPEPKESKTFQEAGDLRKEFSGIPVVKDFAQQSSAMGRIEASASDPSPAGDLSMIFNYMKVLDPGSTVREGEFANAQNAGAIDDKVYNIYNRILNGERLSPDQRQDFLKRGKLLYNNAEEGFMRTYDQYKKIADRRKLPVEDSLIDYRYKFGTAPSNTGGVPKVGEVVDGYKFNGGDPSQQSSWAKQ